MTTAAPSSRSQGAFDPDAVAVTCAPKYAANCTAKWPTPPLPAWIRMRWPSWARAVSTTMPHAVSAASGTPAASTWESEVGLRATDSEGTTTYSAYDAARAREGHHAEHGGPGWKVMRLVGGAHHDPAEVEAEHGGVRVDGCRDPASRAGLRVDRVDAGGDDAHEQLAQHGRWARRGWRCAAPTDRRSRRSPPRASWRVGRGPARPAPRGRWRGAAAGISSVAPSACGSATVALHLRAAATLWA